MNSDRGAWQPPLDFARDKPWARKAKLFRTEPTDPAPTDQPALDVSPEDALMELIASPQTRWQRRAFARGSHGVCIMHFLQLAFGILSEFVLFGLATLAIRFDECTHC